MVTCARHYDVQIVPLRALTLSVLFSQDDGDKTDSDTPKELKSNLEEYWNNNTITTDGEKNNGLFTINHSSPLLNKKRAIFFYMMAVRLLFIRKRAWSDIQVDVAFLCTRVKAPNKSDDVKLAIVTYYIGCIIHVSVVLGSNGELTLLWSVDASFTVHKDMRSYTGAVLTFGKGGIEVLIL